MKSSYLLFLLFIVFISSCSDLNQSFGRTVLSDNKTAENEFPIDSKLYYMSFSKDVCIAVIPGRMNIDLVYQNYRGYQDFVNTTSKEMVEGYEHHLDSFSKYFRKYSLKLVQRHEIEMVLEDFDTGKMAFMPEDLRQKFARETSATYLLVVNFTRSFDDVSHAIDVTERQLVNVSTGVVEASDFIKVRNSILPL